MKESPEAKTARLAAYIKKLELEKAESKVEDSTVLIGESLCVHPYVEEADEFAWARFDKELHESLHTDAALSLVLDQAKALSGTAIAEAPVVEPERVTIVKVTHRAQHPAQHNVLPTIEYANGDERSVDGGDPERTQKRGGLGALRDVIASELNERSYTPKRVPVPSAGPVTLKESVPEVQASAVAPKRTAKRAPKVTPRIAPVENAHTGGSPKKHSSAVERQRAWRAAQREAGKRVT